MIKIFQENYFDQEHCGRQIGELNGILGQNIINYKIKL